MQDFQHPRKLLVAMFSDFNIFEVGFRLEDSYAEFSTLDQMLLDGPVPAAFQVGSPEAKAEMRVDRAKDCIDDIVADFGDLDALYRWLHVIHLMEAVLKFCKVGNEESVLCAKYMAYRMCGLEFDEAIDEDDGDDAPAEQMMNEPEEHLRQMRPEKVLVSYLTVRLRAAEKHGDEVSAIEMSAC